MHHAFKPTATDLVIGFERWNEDESFPVPVHFDDHESLDSLEDQAREALDAGRLEQFIAARIKAGERLLIANAVKMTIGEIVGARHPEMSAYAVAFAVNLHLLQGWSGPRIAAKFGVRKQDFHQLVKMKRARLGLALQLPNMRPPGACDKMRLRNHRHDGT